MTKAVGAALVPEILAQSPPAVKVWRAFSFLRENRTGELCGFCPSLGPLSYCCGVSAYE